VAVHVREAVWDSVFVNDMVLETLGSDDPVFVIVGNTVIGGDTVGDTVTVLDTVGVMDPDAVSDPDAEEVAVFDSLVVSEFVTVADTVRELLRVPVIDLLLDKVGLTLIVFDTVWVTDLEGDID
jgi:hypothetical protein